MQALLDACVLFPRYPRDTLLRRAHAHFFDPLWSDGILDELRRNLIVDLGLSAGDVDRMLAQMELAFPQARVVDYEHLIPHMTNHPKDRHVLAAAHARRADVLVTFNLRDFPSSSALNDHTALSSLDSFLTAMCFEQPDQVIDVLVKKPPRYHRPAMSLSELLDHLALHVPSFVREVSNRIASERRQPGARGKQSRDCCAGAEVARSITALQ